jgi:hypothetical protein
LIEINDERAKNSDAHKWPKAVMLRTHHCNHHSALSIRSYPHEESTTKEKRYEQNYKSA